MTPAVYNGEATFCRWIYEHHVLYVVSNAKTYNLNMSLYFIKRRTTNMEAQRHAFLT